MAKAVSKAAGEKAAKTAWQGDPTYVAARGALQSQLGQYGANLASQANRYDQTYGQDLGNLGLQYGNGARYTEPDKSLVTWNPAKVSKGGDSFAGGGLSKPVANPAASNWDQIHTDTSSGKAFTDQSNDYAARGMLQSTGYQADHAQLGQSFQNQLNDANTARLNYQGDLAAQGHAYIGQSSDSLNQARLAALSAYNAQQQTNAVRAAAGIK